MTYVITEACIGEKNGACVDVCPAACIHTTLDAPQNYIDPNVCIECEQCVLVCPVHAVFLDVELPEEWTEARVRKLYEDAYAGEPFVRVPRKRLPEVAAVSGSNFAEVGVAVGPAVKGRRTAALLSATDNLVKGGAGQAIQNMNLALGLPERSSLEDPGPWPPGRTSS